jgi:hypothetical protein
MLPLFASQRVRWVVFTSVLLHLVSFSAVVEVRERRLDRPNTPRLVVNITSSVKSSRTCLVGRFCSVLGVATPAQARNGPFQQLSMYVGATFTQ